MSTNPIFDELAEAAGLVLDSDELDASEAEAEGEGEGEGEPPAVPAEQEELVGLPAPRHRR